ncbi:MAG TPA: DUF1501 domain-containing protein [Gemmataceae bacterium]|nr:DUF1501 domain-containing protein [Gemmataceae bacterium]
MFNRRQFLTRTLQGSSLLALGSVVPEFIANTAHAAEKGKDNILVVIEMNGGNDGLNTVIPYADDLYHKYRPTLKQTKDQVVRLNDQLGLNPGMQSFRQLWNQGQLAVVQGVGYPNPDRSHFESMDIWQTADPRRSIKTGWLGRSVNELQGQGGFVPILHIGAGRLPPAVQGTPGGAVSINNRQPFKLDLGGGTVAQQKARRKLLEELSVPEKDDNAGDILQFVRLRQLRTMTSVERLQELLSKQRMQPNQFYGPDGFYGPNSLPMQLQLVANLIITGFGTRIFYVMIDGFDTHSMQAEPHRKLLAQLSDAIFNMFNTLKNGGHDKRVMVMTYSEFGRRVQENGSKGTDHGAGSCLFVAGPALKGGIVGEHPSLKDLDSGDLKYAIDFRRVYATLLDTWLHCDSKAVLGGKFEHLEGLKPRKA